MKDKERFINIDDSGESFFTFDEADMIIDTKTNNVYGANNVPDLVKILNSQNSQWQKLKEFISNRSACAGYVVQVRLIWDILEKMQELEGEDE